MIKVMYISAMQIGDLMRSFKLLLYKAEKAAFEEVHVYEHVHVYILPKVHITNHSMRRKARQSNRKTTLHNKSRPKQWLPRMGFEPTTLEHSR